MARFLVTRIQIRVEQARSLSSGERMLEIKHNFFCQPACERFPIDSHSLDVGLGRAPPVDFPRICSCALAVEKGESISMLSPRDGQALGEGLKENRSLKNLFLHNNSIGDAGAKAPGWGGCPRGWMVKFEGKKEACGRCCRSVCLSAFLVRYVGLLECH